MPPAARISDPTSHPGVVVGPGVPNVLIGGMAAAVLGDQNLDVPPAPGTPPLHPPTPFVDGGSATVFIAGRPALRVGDVARCKALIVSGAVNVLIG